MTEDESEKDSSERKAPSISLGSSTLIDLVDASHHHFYKTDGSDGIATLK